MAGKTIALIDVDDLSSFALGRAATACGDRAVVATAAAALADEPAPPDLVVAGADGNDRAIRERVAALRARLPATPVVILARSLRTDTIVALVRLYAADVIGLPLPPEQVAERALESIAPSPEGEDEIELRGESAAIRELRAAVEALRDTRSTVLLTGEPGTGKAGVARWIARVTDPPDTRFIRIDCAAPPALAEVGAGLPRGIPVGEDGRIRPGLIGGTLFFDEVADMDTGHQALLANILQRRIPLDAPTERVRARIVASTHTDLARAVEAERFRADLYYRLNVLRIHVPPLRERLEDLPILVDGLLRRHGGPDRSTPPLTDGFLRVLRRHAWPGNLRELEAVVERALVAGRLLDAGLGEQVLDAPPPPSAAIPPLPNARELGLTAPEEAERARLAEVLVATAGNVARAARRLEIPRSTLRYRIRRYALGSLIPRD